MRNYYDALGEDVFASLPVTFHIKNGVKDPEFARFKAYYEKVEEEVKQRRALRQQRKRERQAALEDSSPEKTPNKVGDKDDEVDPDERDKLPIIRNIWIIKPGENTNCGNGIQVAKDWQDIVDIIVESN